MKSFPKFVKTNDGNIYGVIGESFANETYDAIHQSNWLTSGGLYASTAIKKFSIELNYSEIAVVDTNLVVVRNFEVGPPKPKFFRIDEHTNYRDLAKSDLKNPWTFSVVIDGVEYFPLAHNTKYAYTTCDQAIVAARTWSLHDETVFVVLRNADFTEGRGPMLLNKIFRKFKDAHEFVLNQTGIMGSTMSRKVSFGCSADGNAYASIEYSGYDIQFQVLE